MDIVTLLDQIPQYSKIIHDLSELIWGDVYEFKFLI